MRRVNTRGKLRWREWFSDTEKGDPEFARTYSYVSDDFLRKVAHDSWKKLILLAWTVEFEYHVFRVKDHGLHELELMMDLKGIDSENPLKVNWSQTFCSAKICMKPPTLCPSNQQIPSQHVSECIKPLGGLYPPFSLSIQILVTNKDKLFLLATWHLRNNCDSATLRPPPRRPPPPSTTPPPPPRAKGFARHGWGVKTCCTPVVRYEAWKLLKIQNLQISPRIIASATIFWHARWVTGPRIRQWASQDSKLGSWVCSLVLEGCKFTCSVVANDFTSAS